MLWHLIIWSLSFVLTNALVTELTSEQFTPEGIPGTWVVKFFSPYCHTCKTYAPVFLESVSTLEKEGTSVKFGEVNCIEQGDLCTKLDINGWPAIKVYKDADFFIESTLNRESPQILVDFVRELPGSKAGSAHSASVIPTDTTSAAAPAAATAAETTSDGTSPAEQSEIPQSNLTMECVVPFTKLDAETASGLWFVKFYSPYCGHCNDFAPIWEKIAHAYPDANFGQVNCIENGDLCAAKGVAGWPEVAALREGEVDTVFTERQFTWKGVTNFLGKYKLDQVDESSVDQYGFPLESTSSHEHVVSKADSTPAASAESSTTVTDGPSTQKDHYASRPSFIRTQPITVSHADGKSKPMNALEFDKLVKKSSEPWMIKFYHPMCPHCKEMAPEWEKYALASKDIMNVGQVSCESDFDTCLSHGVRTYPSVQFFVGETRHEFVGKFTVKEFQTYDQMQTGAQVLPVESTDELDSIVNAGVDDGMGIFVYIHDGSATGEDWEALSKQAQNFPAMQSVIYHSANPEIAKSARVLSGGSHLVYVSKAMKGDSGELFYHKFPGSNIPLLMRDNEEVTKWANKVRFSTPIGLKVSQVPHISKFSDVHFVQIVADKSDRQFHDLAKKSFDKSIVAQAQAQEDLRDQRSKMHDDLVKRGKDSIARAVLKTPIEAPLVGKRSFSYISPSQWTEQFGQYIKTPFSPGAIIAVDWYNGRYVDKLDGEPLTVSDLDVAAEALKTGEKFDTKFRRLPAYYNPAIQFKPDLNLGQNIGALQTHHLSIGGVLIISVLGFLFRHVVRKIWRTFAGRAASRGRKGPILTGKME